MAELYLKQGHSARALAIYRRVVRERPEDAGAARRLAEIEATLVSSASERGKPMSFREHIQRIVDQVPGAIAGVVMGFDGIPIDTYEKSPSELDITVLLTEYSSAAQQARHCVENVPESGDVQEISIVAKNVTAVLRPLTSEYFLAVVLSTGGLTGKARYLMRVTAPKLVGELE